MRVMHLDRDANAGFPPCYRNYIEIHRAHWTMQLAKKAQRPLGQMDSLGWLIANVADPIHLLRLETSVFRHKSAHPCPGSSIGTLSSYATITSGIEKWVEGTYNY